MTPPNLIALEVGRLVPNAPDVTILIPAFGVNEFIRESVESALAQVDCAVEVIVVDDGSTPPVKEELTENILSRIVLATKRNAGISAARNTGIALARGDYICLLDGDDKLSNNHCSTALEEFSRAPKLQVYVPDATLFGKQNSHGTLPGGQPNGTLLSEFLPRSSPIRFEKFLLGISPIIGCSIFHKNSIIEAGGYPEDIRMAEDFYLHAKLLLTGAKYQYANSPTYWYRRHSRAMTTRDSITLCEWTLKALDKLAILETGDIETQAIKRKHRVVTNELLMTQTKQMLNSRRLSEAAAYVEQLDVSAIANTRQKAKWKCIKTGLTLFRKITQTRSSAKPY
jgi:cellulose synthase/poly-beta-1,6-N-acetylglucosamine synthase-like glycosyltransferase